MKTRKGLIIAGLLTAGGLFLASCASTSSTRAKPLEVTTGVPVHLGNYRVATVMPFTVTAANTDPSVGARLADNIAARLQNDFGPLFEQVRRDVPPLGAEDEVVITGNIHKYQPGNKVARALFGPVASANFDGDVMVKDARDGRVLLAAPFDKFWGWGGALGASKGMDEMTEETAAAIANTVAQAKGWRAAPESASR